MRRKNRSKDGEDEDDEANDEEGDGSSSSVLLLDLEEVRKKEMELHSRLTQLNRSSNFKSNNARVDHDYSKGMPHSLNERHSVQKERKGKDSTRITYYNQPSPIPSKFATFNDGHHSMENMTLRQQENDAVSLNTTAILVQEPTVTTMNLKDLSTVYHIKIKEIEQRFKAEMQHLEVIITAQQHQLAQCDLEKEAELERVRATADRTQQAMKKQYEDRLHEMRTEYLSQKSQDRELLHEESRRHILLLEKEMETSKQTTTNLVEELEVHIKLQQEQMKESMEREDNLRRQLQIVNADFLKRERDLFVAQGEVSRLSQELSSHQETLHELYDSKRDLGRLSSSTTQDRVHLERELQRARDDNQSKDIAHQAELKRVSEGCDKMVVQLQANLKEVRSSFTKSEKALLSLRNEDMKKSHSQLEERQKLIHDHTMELQSLKNKHETISSHERMKLKTKISTLEKTNQELEETLETQKSQHNKALEALRSRMSSTQQQLIAKLQEEHRSELNALSLRHKKEIAKVFGDLICVEEALKRSQTQQQQLSEQHHSTIHRLSQHLDSSNTQLLQQIQAQKEQHHKEVELLHAQLSELEQLRRSQLMELVTERDEELFRVRELHDETMRKKQQHHAEIVDKLQKEMQLEIGKYRSRIDEGISSQIRQADTRCKEEVAFYQQQLADVSVQCQQRELEFVNEKKSIFAVHQQEIKDLKRAYDEEVEEYKSLLLQEREKVKLGNVSAFNTLKDQYEKQLLALEARHQNALDGSIPKEIKGQYEKTIAALKTQVQLLKEQLAMM
eukprot:m.119144 g.119144  ORF g.119144 m.119144 type:complete len:790 (-) comp9354_c0_seq6:2046-4415(-)